MIIARQSTARTVMVGPVLDADGVAVTDGVVADFKISKNGGAPAALNGSATATHRHTGFYSLALTTSDLDTVGQAEITIDDTTNAAPLKELTIIEESVYDVFYAAGAVLTTTGTVDANMVEVSGDSTAADNLELMFDGTGYAGGTTKMIVASVVGAVGSVTGAVGSVTGNVGGNVTGSVGSVAGAVGSVTGAVGSVTGAVGSVTGNVGGNVTGSVGSLATQAKADVNAEVLDVLNVDTFAEIGQETPAATQTLRKMIGYLYKSMRNKKTQTSSLFSLFSDDTTTVDQKAVVSDDGTTTTVGEVSTGP